VAHKTPKPNLTLLHITTVPMSLGFVAGQVGYIKARGFAVHALSSPGIELVTFGERERVPVHAVEMLRRISPAQDAVALYRLVRCLKRIRPQIVHAHTPKGGLLGMMSAWLARVPVRVYHLHGLPYLTATGTKRQLLRWSEKVSCLLAHQVLCVSPSVRAVAVEEGLCPPEKVAVLRNGSINGVDANVKFNPARFDADARTRVREQYNIPADALIVGFVGRLVRDKGIHELAEAWTVLREEYPRLHLLVAGCFESQDPVMPEVQAQLESDPRVHLTGFVSDTPPLYAVMDVLTLPTYREGFPITPLEASAMALPVVSTRVPGCVDAVLDGVTGTLVPPRDAPALVDALRRYLDDPLLRRRHGQAGRERALRDFQPEAIWEAVYQEYMRLLSERGIAVAALRSWEGSVPVSEQR
jgi:glycosyltransferase involved in cell wall biosynthesis